MNYKKVYIVTSGTYSDYEIEAVFSTKELAKEYVDIHGDYDNRKIAEWDLDTEDLTRKNQWYEVTIYPNDSSCELVTYGELFDSVSLRIGDCGKKHYTFRINTDGSERAKKIASERLMQVMAQPYLFPRLEEACVGYKWRNYTTWTYPTYNYHTKEIVLRKGEFLKE